jgi:hypothetical protein
MKPDLTTILTALAVAVSLGLARDLAYDDAVSSAHVDQPKWIGASISGYPSGSQSGASWNLKGSRDESLPASRDTNPEQ